MQRFLYKVAPPTKPEIKKETKTGSFLILILIGKPAPISEQFKKVEDDFEELDEKEIQDAENEGDASIETEELRKPRCKCKKLKDKPYCASCENWINAISHFTGVTFNYKVAEAIYFQYLKGEAISSISKEDYAKSLEQIEKDLERTFPGQKDFKRSMAGTTGITQLKNLLKSTSRRNSQIGYVQGMNFIMGVVFFHSCEVVAFWLFDTLMHSYGLEKLYSPNLSGLHLHGKVLDGLIECQYPKIWLKLVFFYLYDNCVARFWYRIITFINRMDNVAIFFANRY